KGKINRRRQLHSWVNSETLRSAVCRRKHKTAFASPPKNMTANNRLPSHPHPIAVCRKSPCRKRHCPPTGGSAALLYAGKIARKVPGPNPKKQADGKEFSDIRKADQRA